MCEKGEPDLEVPAAKEDIGEAELPPEAQAMFDRRKMDQVEIIELILSYRNKATDEEKLRQIRVVIE